MQLFASLAELERGLTRDNRHQEGNFIVWVKDAMRASDGKLTNPASLPNYVVLAGGVATLETGASYSRKQRSANTARKDTTPTPASHNLVGKFLGCLGLSPRL